MRELLKQRSAYESFTNAERKIQKVVADFESMRQAHDNIETDVRRLDKLMVGVSKENLEDMMRVREQWTIDEENFKKLRKDCADNDFNIKDEVAMRERLEDEIDLIKGKISNQIQKVETLKQETNSITMAS